MSLITVFSRKLAHGLISKISEISPWAYFRVFPVVLGFTIQKKMKKAS
jgi:hypothetical protein